MAVIVAVIDVNQAPTVRGRCEKRDSEVLVNAAGNDHEHDHHGGEQPSPLALLLVREQGYHDDHENADQCEHALTPGRGGLSQSAIAS